MNTCSFEALDALTFRQLPDERAAEVSAHVATCRMCELQLRRLREDRSALSARSRHTLSGSAKARLSAGIEARIAARQSPESARSHNDQATAHGAELAAAAGIETTTTHASAKVSSSVSARREAHRAERGHRPLLGALAAAALFAILLALPSRQAGVQGARAFELAMSSMDPSLVCRVDERSVSSVESRYGACLVATPRSLPEEFGLCL